MHLSLIFKTYYKNLNYIELSNNKLVDNRSHNVNYVISSFDNLIPRLNNKEENFKFYTVQSTFRTKKSHFDLWGKDSFLLPFNIMMSTFSHLETCEIAINQALEFLFNLLNPKEDNLYCVYGESSKELVEKTYAKFLSKNNFIVVPNSSLLWRAPLEEMTLNGQYIKLYIRHYSGFILLMDCNIFTYQNKKVVDMTFPYFSIDAILRGYNTIYDSSFLKELLIKAKKDQTIYEAELFTCLFSSLTTVISDGARPSAEKSGSPIRSLMKKCFYTCNCNEIDLLAYTEVWKKMADTFLKECGLSFALDAKELTEIWLNEFRRIDNINTKHHRKLENELANLISNCSFDCIRQWLLNVESTYGIDKKYLIQKLKVAEYRDIARLENSFKMETVRTLIPLNYSEGNTNSEFLKSFFINEI